MSYDEHVGRTEGALITFAPAVAQVVREEQLLQEGPLTTNPSGSNSSAVVSNWSKRMDTLKINFHLPRG